MRAPVLWTWDFFTGLGLDGLKLDLACGAALAAAFLAAVPVLGRIVGLLTDTVMKGLSAAVGRRTAYWIANYATFPGVVLHELSHAAGAKLSGAKVESMRLFDPDGQSLGCVRFTCRGKRRRDMAFQRALASCAPVIGGVLFILLFRAAAAWGRGYAPLEILAWYSAFSMACHMDMSGQDMKNYMKGCAWMFPYAAAVFLVFAYYIGHGAR